jgi:DNA (cytosine-5)-methyltransferase 1
MKTQQSTILLGSLFDGIAGFPYAGSFYGIEPVWASEILPQAVSVTRRHFPDMAHVGDITALDGAKLPPVDIITFGSPCQDLSTAGKRAGLSGERSGLFMEAIRIIDEMRRATNGKYPSYAVWENVPGALSSAGGRDFAAVLTAFTKTEVPVPVSGRWAGAGMVRGGGASVAWRILNACLWGVPQRRRRIFLVASFGAGRAGEILFIEKGLRGDFAPCGEARQGIAADAKRGASVAMPGGVMPFAANQRDELRDLGPASGALQAQPGMKQQTFIAENCLNPWDAQQTRVFTEDGTSPTLAGADGGGGRNPGGLVFAPPGKTEEDPAVAAFLGGAGASAGGVGYSEDVSPTLKAGACGFIAPCVCEPRLARTLTARGDGSPNIDGGPNMVAVGVHQNQEGNVTVSDTAYTLAASSNPSARNAPLVAHPAISGTLCASGAGLSRPGGMASEPDLCVAYALQGNMIGRQEQNGPNGSGVSENLSFTLTATDTPAVASVIPIQDKATRHNGGGPTRDGDGCGNGLGVGKAGDPAPTLTSGDHHSVAAVFNRQRSDLFKEQDIASTQAARQYKDATDLVCEAGVSAVDCRNYKEVGDLSGTLQAKDKPGYSLNYQNPVRTGYIVRRLTPTECERLQGFPDGWTRFGAAGEEISDTRRYQMLGNSVAIPCVAYVLGSIAAEINENAHSGVCDDKKEAA